MYYMAEFCRVCLQGEKILKDIMKDKEAPDSLFNKLKLCVSEVEWCMEKSLFMCQGCIAKLNTAFEFKCQCIKAAETLKNFVSQLNGEENKTESKVSVSVSRTEVNVEALEEYLKFQKEKAEEHKQMPFIRLRPEQPLFTPGQLQNVIVSSNTTQSAFPNLLLNLIPTSLLKYPSPPNLSYVSRPTVAKSASQIKDTNQNMFVSINNTLHRLYPIITQSKDSTNHPHTPTSAPKQDIVKPSVSVSKDVSQILNESKSEELSVEIDPSYFDCLEDESADSPRKAEETVLKDWEDVIVSNKISADPSDNTSAKVTHSNNSLPTLNKMLEMNNGFMPPDIGIMQKGNSGSVYNSKDIPFTSKQPMVSNFVPIRPKLPDNLVGIDIEEKMEIFNAGHFMTPKEPEKPESDGAKSYPCELCLHTSDTLKSLNSHIRQFHLGKFPYRCKYCTAEFALRTMFKEHMQGHLMESCDSFAKDTITLEDLNSEPPDSSVFNFMNYKPSSSQKTDHTEVDGDDGISVGEFKCDACPRSFNSAHGLSRHKVRKHNFQNKKKYFVKGMKNAKCDICNREFSTQSYLQLHIKLHYRKSDFRRKVFRKEVYFKDKKRGDIDEKEVIAENDIKDEVIVDDIMDIDGKDNKTEMETDNDNDKSTISEITNSYLDETTDTSMDTTNLLAQSSQNSLTEIVIDSTLETVNDEEENAEEICSQMEPPEEEEGEEDKVEESPVQETIKSPEHEQVKVEVEIAEVQSQSLDEASDIPKENEIISNDDVTISATGIKLKINLRNIKQSSREETAEKSSEDEEVVKESETTEVLPDTRENLKEDKTKEQSEPPSEENKQNLPIDTKGTPQDSGYNEPCMIQISTDQETSTEELLTPNAEFSENLISIEESNVNDIENEASIETQTHFSGYKIEMVNGKPKCNFCSKLFSRKHDLKRHMNNIHLKAIQYRCHLCDGLFYEAFHLTRHLRQHNCFISCTSCTKSFSALRDLKYHIETTHDDSATTQCGTCGIIFPKVKQLKDHMQEHDKAIVYKCHICGEDFGESRELTKHLVGHSGMYSCSNCQATFATEHELNIHFKIHSTNIIEGKKYECEICHNKYKKKRYLSSHVKHCHSTEKKPTEVCINRVECNNSDDST